MSMVGFVDDSTGSCNDFKPQQEDTIDQLLQKMEQDAQLWSNLLYCTGGKLELPKCSFHALHFTFRPNGRPIPSIESYNDRIHIQDQSTHEWISIQSKRAFAPHLTLGHFKAPTSKAHRELQALRAKAARTALLISISPVTRTGAWLLYKTVYVPTVQYTLPQSFFTRQELAKAQASSLQAIISKCGYNRNTSRAIMFAPADYAGGDFIPWHVIQGDGQIKHIIKHWRSDTLVSRTLKIAVLWALWQSGLDRSILIDSETPLPHLECRWIDSLRTFLHSIDAKIYVDQPITSPPERQNDRHIMRHAIDSGMFSRQDLQILNYCRLYLHITTISELFNVEGTQLIVELFNCRREPWFNTTSFVTKQRRPSDYQVRHKWQKLCKQWMTEDGKIAEAFQPGPWLVPTRQIRRRRQSYFIPTLKILYHWNGNSYWEYKRVPGTRHIYRRMRAVEWYPDQESNIGEDECTPVDVQSRGNTNSQFVTVITQDQEMERRGAGTSTQDQSFTDYLKSLEPWETSLLDGVYLRMSPPEILDQLQRIPSDARILIVSDGSLGKQANTYGWVAGTSTGIIFAEHSGTGKGEPTSHRAEGWGMLSGVLFAFHLSHWTHTHLTRTFSVYPITFLSDNNGLVQRVTQRKEYSVSYPNSTLKPDWDLVEQIHQTIIKIDNPTIAVEWVKGHQQGTPDNLSVEAQYNIRADELAGSANVLTNKLPSDSLLPAEQIRLQIGSTIITSHYTKAIREAYTVPAYFNYLQERYDWTVDQRDDINWAWFQRAASTHSFNQVQFVKLVHHKLPTNSEIAKVNPHQTEKCSFCAERETFHHVLTCHNDIATKFRIELQSKVEHYMVSHGATPIFQGEFTRSLLQSLLVEPAPMTDMSGPEPSLSSTRQNHLGQTAILQGFLSSSWILLYGPSLDPDNVLPPEIFFPGLIKVLWTSQMELWQEYQQSIHHSIPSPIIATDHLLRYKTHIRYLHSKREHCLPGHREQYFHEDVESFLQTATGTQMKQYLSQYETAIHASIKEAQRQPIRSLLSFPGFRRQRNAASTPCQSNNLQATDNAVSPTPLPQNQQSPAPGNFTHQDVHPLDQRGNQLLRKHTRWKQLSNPMQSIRKYFS